MSGQLSKCASLRVSNYPYFCGQLTAKAEACNPNAELPGLIVGKKSYNSMDAIKYLRERSDVDGSFSMAQKADVAAFSNIVHTELQIVFDWMMYREYMNLDYLTLPLMRKSIPPFAAFWLSLSTPQSLTWIGAKHAACEYRGIVSTEQATALATSVFQALSDKLEYTTYFFGDWPSSLDACCSSFILAFRHICLPNAAIHDALLKFPSLIRHSELVATAFLPQLSFVEPREYFDVSKIQELKSKAIEKLASQKSISEKFFTPEETSNRLKQKVLVSGSFLLLAAVLMFTKSLQGVAGEEMDQDSGLK